MSGATPIRGKCTVTALSEEQHSGKPVTTSHPQDKENVPNGGVITRATATMRSNEEADLNIVNGGGIAANTHTMEAQRSVEVDKNRHESTASVKTEEPLKITLLDTPGFTDMTGVGESTLIDKLLGLKGEQGAKEGLINGEVTKKTLLSIYQETTCT